VNSALDTGFAEVFGGIFPIMTILQRPFPDAGNQGIKDVPSRHVN
jgi:hypothetical protein